MKRSLGKRFRLILGKPWILKLRSRAKYRYLDMLLSVLAAAFEVTAARIPELREEIARWDDGRTFALGILPNGPGITLIKEEDRVRYLGKGLRSPRVSFLFKNLDAALPVFSGLTGSHHALAECRILVNGSISDAMELNRALIVVQTYLFPGFMLKRILKRPPKLGFRQMIRKGRVYGALLPALFRPGSGG